MDLSNFSFFKLDKNTEIKPFDCGDDDLNEFLLLKSKDYFAENLATTFILEDESKTVAYYSLLNDSLKIEKESFASKSALKRFLKGLVSHPKRHLNYFPAIKIGRLAINQNIQQGGLGSILVNNIINYAINVNEKCACKLITVDAYSQSVGFYEKMGFQFLTELDNGFEERQMFLELTQFIDLVESEE